MASVKPISKEVQVAAALLGRRGGLASGPARMKKMTFEERSRVAKNAIAKRWEKYRREKAARAARAGTGAQRDNPERAGYARGSRSGGGSRGVRTRSVSPK